jgi:hypothetical protein
MQVGCTGSLVKRHHDELAFTEEIDIFVVLDIDDAVVK